MSEYDIREVPLTDIWDEAQALTLLNHEEATDPRLPLSLDKDKFMVLYDLNMLHAFAVLKDTKLVGYSVYLSAPTMHHMNTQTAVCDVVYIHKDHRKGRVGLNLIRYAEHWLQDIGIEWVFLNVKTQLDFGPLLERFGYKHIEKVYSKYLGE